MGFQYVGLEGDVITETTIIELTANRATPQPESHTSESHTVRLRRYRFLAIMK